MKKFYFLLAMLLSFVGATSVFAQDEVTIQVNKDNGQWTSSNAAKTWGGAWATFQTDPQLTITHQSKANNMDYYDGTNIEFFDRVYPGATGTRYDIAVQEGWYITGISMEFRCSASNNKKTIDTDGPITITLNETLEMTNESNEEFILLEANDLDKEGKMSTIGMTITYTSGSDASDKDHNAFAQTRNFTVKVKKLGESDAAWARLLTLITEYDNYNFEAGTAPGLYGEAEVTEFEDAKKAVHDIDGNPEIDELSDAEKTDLYVSLYKRLQDAYEAVLASKVPMTLADGYYRLLNGQDYTETITNEETEEEETIHKAKYLYTINTGEKITANWHTPEDLATDCTSLWKVTNKDGGYDICSMATDGRFNEEKPVTLTVNGENLMALDPVTTTSEGITYVNIRQATREANSGQIYLHCGGHGNGSGKSGSVTLWYSTYSNGEAHASEWVFVPVSEDEAATIIDGYKDIKDRELMLLDYQKMMTEGTRNLEIAKDLVTKIDEEKPLITDVNQFSSPYTETNEGSIEALIDNDASTFWHSAWSGGNVANGTHYLQVEIHDADVATLTNAAIKITRRAVANDHVTLWGVYGTNDAEAEKADCESLGEISTPFGNNKETIVSSVFPANNYKYLRFYINGTTTGRGYGHVSEFQLFPAEIYQSPTAQANFMGDLAKNLETVLNDLKGKELDDVSTEDYLRLKAAYDAFMAKFVDPTALRETLAEVEGAENLVVIGTNPGFWADNSAATTFKTTYNAAVDYDAKGDFTPENSQNFIETLKAQKEAILASAIKIQTGKWYKIRFATEEEFDQYGWDKVAGNGTTDKETGEVTNEELFGKYITPSYFEERSADSDPYVVASRVDADDLGLGTNLFFDDDEDIDDDDLAMFRFIAVGDTAFVLQNKGTNLFLKAAGGTGAVTLSAHPTLFNVSAIGYGENVIAAKSLTGENQNYLHAQVSGNMLVTWDANTLGSRSGFYIEAVEDVASNYAGTEFNVPVAPGALNTFCFPIEITPKEGQMWGVNSIDRDKNTISLMKVERAIAGRPFIFINGETTDYNEENEAEMVVFTHNYTIAVTEPLEGNALKGTFAPTKIDRGELYAEGNTFKVSKISLTDVMEDPVIVGANKAYIAPDSKFSTTADVVVEFDPNAEDGIQTALLNVSKSGAVYTIDGRLVSKSATLNDLQKFGKGLYILNGTKVIVK